MDKKATEDLRSVKTYLRDCAADGKAARAYPLSKRLRAKRRTIASKMRGLRGSRNQEEGPGDGSTRSRE